MLTEDETVALRERLSERLNVRFREKLIRAIEVNSSYHWQPRLHIEIGTRCAMLERDTPPEEILAIFEATTFMVVTPGRGYRNNLPYFFAKEDVQRVEYRGDQRHFIIAPYPYQRYNIISIIITIWAGSNQSVSKSEKCAYIPGG